MKTIAINVEKGGAGKTMIACHLAWHLADAGHRVLFLDLDRQGNATSALADFEDLGSCKPLFESSFDRGACFPRVAMYANRIGGEYDADYPRALTNVHINFPALRPHFDYCVIDTPPSWSWVNFAALLVCDHLIVPVELGPFGPAATKQVSNSIATVNTKRRLPIHVVGLIPNRVRANDRHQMEMLAAVRAKIGRNLFGAYLPERALQPGPAGAGTGVAVRQGCAEFAAADACVPRRGDGADREPRMTDFSGFDVFSEKAAVAEADRVQLLDPALLYPDPANGRREIDLATIDELAATIKERGQLQPITVAPTDADGRYRIMFGERRWRACQQLGMRVRAIVSKTDDIEQVRIDQFIENDQREDLTTADMIRFVVGQVEGGRSLAELARTTGRNRSVLSRYQGLARAPDYIAALFADISMRSAVALCQAAKSDDAATRAFVANTAVEDMTVAACGRLAREVSAATAGPNKLRVLGREVRSSPTARQNPPAAVATPTSDAQRETPIPTQALPSEPTSSAHPVERERPRIEIEGKGGGRRRSLGAL